MVVIPLQAIPAQAFSVTLNGQSCRISLYQKADSFYIDLSANGVPVRQCRMVRNSVWIVRYRYLGLSGDLVMVDTQGSNDSPTYDSLGTRYQLLYYTADEIAS